VLRWLTLGTLLPLGLMLLAFSLLLKSMPAALAAMIPLAMPFAAVFGVMSLAGVKVDLPGLLTAMMALGVACGHALHFLHAFRESGTSRRDAVLAAMAQCGPAIGQTSGMIGLAALVMVPVDFLPVSRFGWQLSALIFAGLFGALVLLPQMLASPLGVWFVPPPKPDATKSNALPATSPHLAQIDAAA
jgi:predicted RND superfamily exporter protein